MTNFFNTKIKTYQVLSNEGKVIIPDYKVTLTDAQIKESLHWMKLSRRLDQRMIKMQRQGRIYTFIENTGEEALQIATSLAMIKEDIFLPAFRSGATMIHLGMPIWQMITLWSGNEVGNRVPPNVNLMPINIPIATQFSHAAGFGFAQKLLGKKGVPISIIGDGGTSEGEFYEAINFASVREWPVVFCINNNQWAISTPTNKATSVLDICTKAIAAGIPFIKVDGNDIFASYDAMMKALDYARTNQKPILVEFMTYRMGAHTTSDNPRVYRTAEYEKVEEKKDPILRLEKYILKNKIMTQKEIDQDFEKIDQIIDENIEKSKSYNDVSIDEVFDYTYENLTEELKEQKKDCKDLFK